MQFMTKLIAFHLPQFHSIPENDEWWGKGFTEWVNTKKATASFSGHYQPREPLNDNYYDMLDYETRKWQADIAKKNGIYGFCYYHYWFNGKLLLEKPLEMLLDEKDIDMNYCFCWANEPWTRAWDGSEKEVIMPQEYGKEEEWENHFKYLLKFFKDKRYIKNEGRPMLVIYRTNIIPHCEEMIDYFEKRCLESGFEGIYVIEEKNSFQKEGVCKNSKAVMEFEPMNTIVNDKDFIKKCYDKVNYIINRNPYKDKIMYFDYDNVWKKIIKRKITKDGKKKILGAFVDWDNTARKGTKATVFKGASPEKFGKYMKEQLRKAKKEDVDFIFINAWNEWAEGTYLEPDKKYGYSYLDKIREIVSEE